MSRFSQTGEVSARLINHLSVEEMAGLPILNNNTECCTTIVREREAGGMYLSLADLKSRHHEFSHPKMLSDLWKLTDDAISSDLR